MGSIDNIEQDSNIDVISEGSINQYYQPDTDEDDNNNYRDDIDTRLQEIKNRLYDIEHCLPNKGITAYGVAYRVYSFFCTSLITIGMSIISAAIICAYFNKDTPQQPMPLEISCFQCSKKIRLSNPKIDIKE